MSRAEWQHARNVLCVRLDSLGDVLMCTPAMRAIKGDGPRRVVTLLTSESGAAAARYIPELDGVLAYAAPWMKSERARGAALDADMLSRIAARQFDAAVIFTSYSQSPLPAALLCHMAGIPLRLAHCRENPYLMLSDWVAEAEPDKLIRHEVQRQLDLVAGIGWQSASTGLSFRVPDPALTKVRRLLATHGIGAQDKFILMHPGASAPSRRYPARLWAQVISGLAARRRGSIVLTGEASETGLLDAICDATGARVLSLAGQLDLGQLGAAIQLATVMICNNTGPAHIAAALGTPLVDLYALTNPQHTPWQVAHRLLFHDVPCRFCYKSLCPEGHNDCLSKLEPMRVVQAVCSLMDQAPGRQSTSDRLPWPARGA
ncbi:glycosyltransferase family 9 protein [Massilia sp. TSP1-1-2]|uniref:glycosyltransferase family 9 protein n=1 Tax=Massilia sp. TSP1-1-2 TaxID=2804649 RepID=UPI003CF41ED0